MTSTNESIKDLYHCLLITCQGFNNFCIFQRMLVIRILAVSYGNIDFILLSVLLLGGKKEREECNIKIYHVMKGNTNTVKL